MRKLACFAGLASIPLLVLLAAPLRASASTSAECMTLLSTLRADTESATYLRGDLGLKLEQQLLAHLDKALNELGLDDLKDALKQMANYEFTLARGVDSAKIDGNDAAALQI